MIHLDYSFNNMPSVSNDAHQATSTLSVMEMELKSLRCDYQDKSAKFKESEQHNAVLETRVSTLGAEIKYLSDYIGKELNDYKRYIGTMRQELTRIKAENLKLKEQVVRMSNKTEHSEPAITETSIVSEITEQQRQSVSTLGILQAAQKKVEMSHNTTTSIKAHSNNARRNTMLATPAKTTEIHRAARLQYGKPSAVSSQEGSQKGSSVLRARSSLFKDFDRTSNSRSNSIESSQGKASQNSGHVPVEHKIVIPPLNTQLIATKQQQEAGSDSLYASQKIISIDDRLFSSEDFCLEDIILDQQCDYLNLQAK